jgi:hypothetical protein
MVEVIVEQRQLEVGDTVSIGMGGYSTATVTKIREGLIYLVRPYVHLDAQTGIDYIGVENWTMTQDSQRTITKFVE